MCGIAGTAGGAGPSRALLERMAETMVKRGPDGQGLWYDETAGIACRRLAIIDLHERSDQPLHFGSLHIVFNGEIYNYRELREELRGRGHSFETEGDCEVLLHAWAEWGESALERLNGMFAFAIWDSEAQRLTLAADPFGEKPLYYALADGRLVFGSELKAILLDPAVTAAADEDALAAYLARNAPLPPAGSFFRGIRRLPAAHLLRWEGGRVETERYWKPQRIEVPVAYDDAVTRLRELFADSIRLRLRSDVPVGTSLSGGIDSSTVVAFAAEIAGDHTRHAFTATFPGFARDEWRYAHEVAERAGVTEHHAVEATAAEFLEDLDTLVLDHEEPVGSLSIYAQWRVMAAAHEAGVTVLLDGQGGDELFAGYDISAGFALREGGPGALLRHPKQAGVVGRALAMDFLPRWARRAYWRRIATPYAAPGLSERASWVETDALEWANGTSSLRRELLTQSFETSLPQLLRWADRSSMAHSREVRLPFLDRRIAELALSLPAEFVYRDGVSKRIVRDAARGLAPDVVLARTDKVGFEPPQRRWLNEQPVRERIAEVLLDPAARKRGLYETSAIERDLAQGEWRDHQGIWRALNAELWLRQLVEARRAQPQPV
jgi:asparagine synthase (glutamine-hydrolysing)